MSKVIIYKQDSGIVAIISPAPEAVERYGLVAIAQKDVPAGKPYKIIDASEVPSDRTFRDAWTVDDAELTDGIGGRFDSFDEVPA